MEKKSTHEIRIIHNHYKTELPQSTFMIERIIMSDGVEIYKDIQSVDMYTKDQSSIFSQFENWIDDNVSLEECQGRKNATTKFCNLFHTVFKRRGKLFRKRLNFKV